MKPMIEIGKLYQYKEAYQRQIVLLVSIEWDDYFQLTRYVFLLGPKETSHIFKDPLEFWQIFKEAH